MTDQNPYAPPINPPESPPDPAPIDLNPVDRRNIEDLIRESRNLYLVVLLSIICIPLAGIFIPAWYLFQLWQWQTLAQKYPALLTAGLPRHSIQTRFKSCRWKLIASIVVGVIDIAILLWIFGGYLLKLVLKLV